MTTSAINTSVVNQPEPDFWSNASSFSKKAARMQRIFATSVVRGFAWADYFGVPFTKTARLVQKTFRHAHHFFYWLRYPGENILDFKGSLTSLKNSITSGSIFEMGERVLRTYALGIFTIDLFADFAKILHKESIITLSQRTILFVNAIGFLSSTAMVTIGLFGIKDRVVEMAKSELFSHEFNISFIRMVNRVSLTSIGVFGIATFTGVAVVPILPMLIASTTLLVTSLGRDFYENFVVAK